MKKQQPQTRGPLRRRTSSANIAKLGALPENQFWAQAQTVLAEYLLRTDYGPKLYVAPMVAVGKSVAEDIKDFLLIPRSPRCMLVVGQYGVGKTSALAHLEDSLGIRDGLGDGWIWIYFDGNRYAADLSQDPQCLLSLLSNATSLILKRYLQSSELTTDSFWKDLFLNDDYFASDRLRVSENDQAKINQAVEKLVEQPIRRLNASLRYLVRKVGEDKVVLVLDNLDPLSRKIQLDAVRLATQIAMADSLKTIITVRRSTESELRYHDPTAFSAVVRTAVEPPDMTEVIRLRIKHAFQDSSPLVQNATLGEGALRARIQDSTEFADVLVTALSSPPVQRLLHGLSNESVREALHFALRVYNSHFIDARRIIRKLSPADAVVPSLWKGSIPYHIVIKALMLSNYPVYRGDVSWVGNVLGTELQHTHMGPFVRLHVMSYLNRVAPGGEVILQQTKKELLEVLELEQPILDMEMGWLASKSFISYPDPEHVILTMRGEFVLRVLANDIEYLTHIAPDVEMYEDLEEQIVAPADKATDRLNNLSVLLEYLLAREARLLTHLARNGLRDYVHLFKVKGFIRGMLNSVIHSVDTIRVDSPQDDMPVVDAVRRVRERLAKLGESEDMRTIRELLRRFEG